MSEHTPGPWVFIGTDPAEGVDCFWILAQPALLLRGITKEIGSVNGSQSDPEQAANARLIASAPDLLEALQAVVDVSSRPDGVDVIGFLVNLRDAAIKARAAIAKATGAA